MTIDIYQPSRTVQTTLKRLKIFEILYRFVNFFFF